MGIGDAILACGEARHMHSKSGRMVHIRRRDGKPQWFDVWDGVPFLARRATANTDIIVNGGGARGYIDQKTPEKWVWKKYHPRPGMLVFTPDEVAFAAKHAGRVMIEPNGKNVGHLNKVYPRWTEVVRAMPDTQFVQCGFGDTRWISEPNVRHVVTDTFRKAAAVLAVSRALASNEGGLVHAAAAVGVRAVVTMGGFIAPEVIGYSTNRNLFTGTGLGCGMRTTCEHCRKAYARITPDEIVGHIKELIA